MLGSSGYARRSQPAICWGDHACASLVATASRRAGCVAKRHRLGRRPRAHAAASAAAARYRRRPPCRCTSLLTVDGARRTWRLMCRSDVPRARPREMASRSTSVSARRPRWRADGGIPPVRATSYRTTWAIRRSARPMAFSDSPWRQRRHSSVFSASVSRGPRRRTMRPPSLPHVASTPERTPLV